MAKATKKSTSLKEVESAYNEVNAQLQIVTDNYEKFTAGGVVAAGRRMRKALQVIRKQAQLMRLSIQAEVNNIKGK